MRLTFLGHQSWFVSHGRTNLLIDPLFLSSFGNSSELQLEIWPPRHIRLEAMPKPDAVLLTHEHPDHFHPASLRRLPRKTPMLIGPLMPEAVERRLQRDRFPVKRLELFDTIRIGELEIVAFQAGEGSDPWEARVVQPYIRPVDEEDLAVFMTVDAVLSEAFRDAVVNEVLPAPRCLVFSNNSGIRTATTPAHPSVHHFPGAAHLGTNLYGLRVLAGLLLDAATGIDAEDVVICGDGYIPDPEAGVPFTLSDHARLASVARSLSEGDVVIHGVAPGDVLELRSNHRSRTRRASWIRRIAGPATKSSPCPPMVPRPLLQPHDDAAAERRAIRRLPSLLAEPARTILLTPTCDELFAAAAQGNPRPLLFSFQTAHHGAVGYAFDLLTSSFEPTPGDRIDVYPFGLMMHLRDFEALCDGLVQWWDLTAFSVFIWYGGDFAKSPFQAMAVHFADATHGLFLERLAMA